ncbi:MULTISPECIES: VOC family protein [Bacillus]|uniref:Glyoxalase family protein, putative n=1 Tax=Bacillus mojavensis TaxID=72360 RepID=A0AAP3G049_BACMO|nr:MULTISPECIES: VOC family protein [Bacillus]MCC2931377.1 VOC family protein [Bacillus sp. LBG-1-113]MCY8105468.1 VOC family protein [Bacillus mojavensis]MCY8481881.1 VOC family protein [Bacillus mojavensis]MCY8508252.1 VOC family protein [Bacillus mojavensis]MEC1666948.1 VOC family protein [Bacillus mojavensis]
MTFHFHEIDHIQLAAPKGCETAARQFYGGILGFQEIEKPDELKARGGVWFTFGNRQLHIGIEEPFVPAKKAHPAFEVLNIEGLKEHVKLNGIAIVEDNKLPGADRFYISDPFGNRLEMLEWQTTHKKG